MKKILSLSLCFILLTACADSAPQQDSIPSPTSSPVPTATQSAEATPKATSTPDTRPAMPLLGLKHVDITINIENAWGVPKAEFGSKQPSALTGTIEASSSVERPNTDVLSYTIWTDDVFNVCYALFEAFNFSGSDEFSSLANNYLGYCSTIPYDTSMPNEAKAWVSENIEAALSGDDFESQFGNGIYTLYGNDNMVSLEIAAAGYDEWIANVLS